MLHRLDIVPCAKPRMTRRDKWLRPPRPCVARYRAFCTRLRLLLPGFAFPKSGASVQFILPMPQSWGPSKKRRMNGRPHQQRPDVDNLLKAVFDALEVEDAHIWQVAIEKRWGYEGRIHLHHEHRTAA